MSDDETHRTVTVTATYTEEIELGLDACEESNADEIAANRAEYFVKDDISQGLIDATAFEYTAEVSDE